MLPRTGKTSLKDKNSDGFLFDLATFHNHLDQEAEIEVVIRGHLYLEHVLIEMIKETLSKPQLVKLERVSFLTKLELCAANQLVDEKFFGAIRFVNTIRNRVAHDLTYELTPTDKKTLFELVPQFGQTLILERGETGERFELDEIPIGHFFKVMGVLLDLNRQRHVEWKKNREEAIKNAKSVLTQFQNDDQ